MKILNKIKLVSLFKAYTEGIFSDTPQNRKSGRVGMSYADYANKIKGEKSEENKEVKKEDNNKIEEKIKDLKPLNKEQKVELISKKISVPNEEAKDIEEALTYYSHGGYKGIRKCRTTKAYSHLQKYADNIEKFIEKGEKIKTSTYRGAILSNSEIDSLFNFFKNGKDITMKGISSWTIDKDRAENFTSAGTKEENSAIFTSKTQPEGVDISSLSDHPTEREVIFSEKQKYKIINIEKSSYIYRSSKCNIPINKFLVELEPLKREFKVDKYKSNTTGTEIEVQVKNMYDKNGKELYNGAKAIYDGSIKGKIFLGQNNYKNNKIQIS